MAGRQLGQRDRRIKTFAGVTDPTNKVAPRDRGRDSTLTPRQLGGRAKARQWVHNESDELAIRNGCRFDQYRADHFRQVCEDHFRFWEGSHSGRPFILEDYQWEDLAPLWGWVLFDEHHGRWVRRFRRGSIWWPKKNGKSPLAGATTLYLLKWDNEPGHHVFNAARDGKQAGIIFNHAVNMIHMMAPLLKRHFGINKTTKTISYDSTFSDARVLSCDNVLSQEGLNGSVVIDEGHVVDDALAAVLADMGAHRAESMQITFSTAGGSPVGFGRKEWEYGLAVNDGRYEDYRYFFREHSAPQDATDADCGREEIWQQANPGWGTLINPAEFADSYAKARRSSYDFANWKQRRLNIWQRTASPFISDSVWQSRRSEYTLGDLAGLGGGLGIDLARVKDTCAAVFVCWRGDELLTWPMMWLPRATAINLASEIPFEDWERAGHITLMESETTNFDLIQHDIEEAIETIRPTKLCFDKAMMTDFAERLHESTGIELYAMPQTFNEYGPPTADFERYVIEGKLRHPGNEVARWQLGHTYVKEVAGRRKPMKDSRWASRTIDSVQATIMGIKALSEVGEPDTTFAVGGYWDKWLQKQQ